MQIWRPELNPQNSQKKIQVWCHIYSCSTGRQTQAALWGSDQVSMFGEFQVRPLKDPVTKTKVDTTNPEIDLCPLIRKFSQSQWALTHTFVHTSRSACVYTPKRGKKSVTPGQSCRLMLEISALEGWGKGYTYMKEGRERSWKNSSNTVLFMHPWSKLYLDVMCYFFLLLNIY